MGNGHETIDTFTTMTPKFVTKTLPPPTTVRHPRDGSDGPSWGLIIPLIMIGVFLTSVAICLWWHKWKDKRTLHIQRDHNGSSFHRSYRYGRSNRSGFDAVRDSTRSTTPLRSSLSEKKSGSSVKVKNVNVIPVQQRGTPGKYPLYWDKMNLKSYPTPTSLSNSGRIRAKPLSPINEIDSPTSMKLSELSRNYDVSAQASFSPYHLMWYTSSNPPPSYEQTDAHRRDPRMNRYPPASRKSSEGFTPTQQSNLYEPPANSPFYPNNNTPTTECDTGSECSHNHRDEHRDSQAFGSQYTSNPSSTKSSLLSITNTRLSVSVDTEGNHTSLTSHSGYQTSTFHSGHTNTTETASPTMSSLPSSIAQFSKQNVLLDDNNNSMVVPNAYMSYPLSKVLNYTLASSIASSDTHHSNNTSLLPNLGSNNTSSYPGTTGSRSYQQSAGPSGPTSPEDLSKLVDELSSIRPVEESSMRPNSSIDPASRIVSTSGNSNLHRSWSVIAEIERASMTSTNIGSQESSQNGSLYWDSYPLNHTVSKSYPDLPLQMHDSFVQQTHRYSYQRPVLMETQYWV